MPGSSKHEWWLDKVNRGTCCGFVSMIEASISLLYIRVWLNQAAKKNSEKKITKLYGHSFCKSSQRVERKLNDDNNNNDRPNCNDTEAVTKKTPNAILNITKSGKRSILCWNKNSITTNWLCTWNIANITNVVDRVLFVFFFMTVQFFLIRSFIHFRVKVSPHLW